MEKNIYIFSVKILRVGGTHVVDCNDIVFTRIPNDIRAALLIPVCHYFKHWQKQGHGNREWDMAAHKTVIMEIMSG